MKLHSDLGQRAVVHGGSIAWTGSPASGVQRRPLERDGGEVARASTIVRFAPGSRFPAHTHAAGEEFLVLEGTFQDDEGDYPVGTYVRNPPGSRHTPGSRDGCVIFVKLRQMSDAQRERVIVRADVALDREQILYEDADERVQRLRLPPGSQSQIAGEGGVEVFVVEGDVQSADDRLERWDWLRQPPAAGDVTLSTEEGCVVWVKSGHLREMSAATDT